MAREECEAIEGAHVTPGWGCCACDTYNGQVRLLCKGCRHLRCDRFGRDVPSEGLWALLFRAVGGDGPESRAVAFTRVGPFERAALDVVAHAAFEQAGWDAFWLFYEEPPPMSVIAPHAQAGRAIAELPGARVLVVWRVPGDA